MTYAKAFAAVLATVVSAVLAALNGDNAVSSTEWVNVAIAGIGALSVAVVPNLDAGIGHYAKSVVAVLLAALTLLSSAILDGVSTAEWLQILVAGLGAVGVYAVPNVQRLNSEQRLRDDNPHLAQ